MDSAIAKAFGLLEALSRAKGPSRLSGLAAELGMQKSTVHRELAELIDLGYAAQDPATGLYRPTLRTWEIATESIDDCIESIPVPDVTNPPTMRVAFLARADGTIAAAEAHGIGVPTAVLECAVRAAEAMRVPEIEDGVWVNSINYRPG